MSTQPLPLLLADAITDYSRLGFETEQTAKLRHMKAHKEAAAELRRLHEENERCRQVCAATAAGWREETKELLETLELIAKMDLSGADDIAKALIADYLIHQARATIKKHGGEI